MLNIGIPEITIIVVVVILFFFGKNKLIEWAKAIGQAKGFKENKN
ncbi:MAG: twin-arginine translocase TatA/TatE family subunit [archaeon]|jgi:Sec-independent protein translocase protein TatA|nr:twin-arginine translocase TatA/TatE family subunit [archaeon]